MQKVVQVMFYYKPAFILEHELMIRIGTLSFDSTFYYMNSSDSVADQFVFNKL